MTKLKYGTLFCLPISISDEFFPLLKPAKKKQKKNQQCRKLPTKPSTIHKKKSHNAKHIPQRQAQPRESH